jgi:hypothetical protein
MIGAALLGGLPALWMWAREREKPCHVEGAQTTKSVEPAKNFGKLESRPDAKLVFSADGPQPRLQIGASNVFFVGSDQYGQLIFPALQRSQFKIESLDGNIKVSTSVTNTEGVVIAEVIQNEWKVAPPPGTWDKNYDDNALEVKDPKGRIVLQVRLLPDRVQMQGAWPLGPEWKASGASSVIVRADPEGTGAQIVLFPFDPKADVVWPEIKPLFQYPSELHRGELAQQ